MPDILLFGATGYTGRLTAHALGRRGADFVLAGRNRAKLEALAADTGAPEVRVAEVGDIDGLTRALDGVRAMITCVGPFMQLGDTAVEAALRAGCHYIDSTGEGPFIRDLIATRSKSAREAGIAMAPALGFDEVPADVAATLATEGFERADLVLTYALPSRPSSGTAKSVIGIVTSRGPWIVNGEPVEIEAGQHHRWAPMPAPLGPRRSVSYPLAEGHLAPLHLDLHSLRIFGTAGPGLSLALRTIPAVKPLLSFGPVRGALEAVIDRTVVGPEGKERNAPWTILAEARMGRSRRNVVMTGRDPYGLTGETLAAAAMHMADDGYEETGVLSPVQAVGIDNLQKELIEHGVSIETYES